MVEGLAKVCGVSRQTIYAWARNPDTNAITGLSDTIERIGTVQHLDVVTKSFNGKGNPTIASLIMKSQMGYVERQQVEHTGPGGGPVQTAALTITSDMSQSEAAAVYKELLAGDG